MSQPVSSATQALTGSLPPSSFPNVDKIVRVIREFLERLRDGGRWAWNALTSRRVVAISGAIGAVSSAVGCFSPRLGNRLREGALLGWAGIGELRAASAEAERDALKSKSAAQTKEIASLRVDTVLRGNDALRVRQLESALAEHRNAERAATPARVAAEAELAKAKEMAARLKQEAAAANARAAKAEAERDEAVMAQREGQLRVSWEVIEALCGQIVQAHQRGEQLGPLYEGLQSNYQTAQKDRTDEFERLMTSLSADDPNRQLFERVSARLTDVYNAASMQLGNTYLRAIMEGIEKANFLTILADLTGPCAALSQELTLVSKIPSESKRAASLIAAQRLLDDALAIGQRVGAVCALDLTTSTQEV